MNATLTTPVMPAFELKNPMPPGRPVQAPKPRSMIDEAIRRLAYRKWEAAGKPICDGVTFWLEAEREIFTTQMKPEG